MTPRSYLFVPGDRPERFDKALGSGADVIVLDLEDAVLPDSKDAAREAVAAWLAAASPDSRERSVVRINDAATAWFGADLATVAVAGAGGVMLPKTETPQQIAAVRAAVQGAPVLALIESARGVAQVDDLAAAPGVSRLVFGTLDFALDLDIQIAEDRSGLAYAASRIAIASRAAGLPAPVAGVTPEINDEAKLLEDFAWSRRYGFAAKLCIHPKQVAPIHAALQPSEQELNWARRVIAAAEGSSGAVQVDGRMVDKPVLLRARALLARGAG